MEQKKVAQNIQHLLQELNCRGEITTAQAVHMLGISESTARRLFARMEAQGSALRTFGGIQRTQQKTQEYIYETLVDCNREAKRALALRAAELVNDKDVIYLDGGTTLALFTEELARRLRGNQLHGVVLFTNSLSTLNALNGLEGVTLLGGRFRPKRQDFCGHLTEAALRQLRFTKCFLGTDAMEPERGFTTTDFETAQINILVLRLSQKKYVLADTAKLTQTSLTAFAAPSEAVVVSENAPDISRRNAHTAAGFSFLPEK